MTKRGGVMLSNYEVEEQKVRADLCAIASKRSFQHGCKIIDDILQDFIVTRKLMKEK